MNGKSYYITTVADWRRHAHRFAQSHWIALGDPNESPPVDGATVAGLKPGTTGDNMAQAPVPVGAAAKILVLVEADEGVHLALEDDAAFEALPHALAQKPISTAAQAALASHGVLPGAATFDATEQSLASTRF